MKTIIYKGLCKGVPLLFLFSLFSIPLFSQESQTRTIAGNVIDDTGEPVTGATVKVVGTTDATTVDLQGNYKIQTSTEKVTLSFSFIGYESLEKVVNPGQQVVNVVLRPAIDQLDEVVVVGYGTMKRSDVTGSIGHVSEEVIETTVATSVADYLKGSVAGVNLSIDNSSSGGGSIQVRGPASLTASTSPLIVLDGNIFYGNIDDINPNDIASIDVLKDASSTAIYGAKGSAGVIMINTKKGQTDEPVINVSASTGLSKLITIPALPTPAQYVQRRSDYWETIDYFQPENRKKGKSYYDNPDNLPDDVTKEQWAAYDGSFSGDYIETWLNRLQFTNVEIENYKLGKTVSWRDHVYRTGHRQDYSSSISGRSSKLNYYASLGYTDNQGFQVGDDFQATRGRINLDADITS